MKAMFEKVLPTPNSSWRYCLYELNDIPFNWHYHPEYEICLTLNSRGQRYIGDHVDYYGDGDLILLGPKLPHTWCSSETICNENKIHRIYVAQIPAKWIESITKSMPEMAQLDGLLERSKRAVIFDKEVASQCADVFLQMVDESPMQRFIGLFKILSLMINDKNSRMLSSSGYNVSIKKDLSTERIDKMIDYIHKHYTQNISAQQMADIAHMSVNHFHRFLKQRTEKTFTELVNQLRLGKACSLLINSDMPISNISDVCGFNNISNFNRRFLQHKQQTPSAFRNAYASQLLRE